MARRATREKVRPDGTVVLDLGSTMERIEYAETVGIHGVKNLAISGPCSIQISAGQDGGWRLQFKEDSSLEVMWTGWSGMTINPEVSNRITLVPRPR